MKSLIRVWSNYYNYLLFRFLQTVQMGKIAQGNCMKTDPPLRINHLQKATKF